MSKRKGEKRIDLSCSLDTLKCFGRERKTLSLGGGGGVGGRSSWRKEEWGDHLLSCFPGLPESPGGVTSSRAALLALVLPGIASRPSAVLFLITERCRGAPWVGLVPGAPRPRGSQRGTRSGTHTYVLWRPVGSCVITSHCPTYPRRSWQASCELDWMGHSPWGSGLLCTSG